MFSKCTHFDFLIEIWMFTVQFVYYKIRINLYFQLFDWTFSRYRYTNSKKTRKRIVQKNGECNVTKANVAKRRRRYLQDIFTTLVDVQVLNTTIKMEI